MSLKKNQSTRKCATFRKFIFLQKSYLLPQPLPNNLPLVQAIFLSERGRDIDGAIIVSSKDRSSAGWGWKIQPRLYTVETSGNSMQGVEITGLRNVENEPATNKLFYFLRKNSLLWLLDNQRMDTNQILRDPI